jgi:hypothetical protein
MAKIKIDSNLYDRAKKVAELAGYSSVDEFILHVIETEVGKLESVDEEQDVTEQLRGLGYLD